MDVTLYVIDFKAPHEDDRDIQGRAAIAHTEAQTRLIEQFEHAVLYELQLLNDPRGKPLLLMAWRYAGQIRADCCSYALPSALQTVWEVAQQLAGLTKGVAS